MTKEHINKQLTYHLVRCNVMNIGIIGGGRGGLAVLDLLMTISSVRVLWIADVQPDAPALVKAREVGVSAVTDFVSKLTEPNLEMVVEVTGVEKVKELLKANIPEDVALMDASAAKLLITIVESREQLFEKIHSNATELAHYIEQLNESAEQIRASVEQLAGEAEKLASHGEMLSDTSQIATTEADKTQQILKIINGIAKQTNIIGLNAAIEAARVGQAGQGFSVVATEIRKLAENTSVSTNEIGTITSTVKDYMTTINNGIKESTLVAQSQAAATEETLAGLESMADVSQKLQQLSLDLLKLQ